MFPQDIYSYIINVYIHNETVPAISTNIVSLYNRVSRVFLDGWVNNCNKVTW